MKAVIIEPIEVEWQYIKPLEYFTRGKSGKISVCLKLDETSYLVFPTYEGKPQIQPVSNPEGLNDCIFIRQVRAAEFVIE